MLQQSTQLQRWMAISATVVLNSAIVIAPRGLYHGMETLGFPELFYVIVANLFCLGDLLANRSPSLESIPVHRDRDSLTYCRWTGWLVLLLVAGAPLWISSGSTNWAASRMFVGVVLVCLGSSLRFLAIRTLGSFFESEVNVRREQPVVRHGVYSLVRHPSECGTLLATLGAVVYYGNFAAFAIWLVVLVPLVVYRVHREDLCLQSAFGEPYRDYARRVSRLIPRLY